MLPNRAVDKEFDSFGDDFAEWRKIEWVEDFEACGELPGREESQDPEHAEPVGCDVRTRMASV